MRRHQRYCNNRWERRKTIITHIAGNVIHTSAEVGQAHGQAGGQAFDQQGRCAWFSLLPRQCSYECNPEVDVRFKAVVVGAEAENELVIKPILPPVGSLGRMMYYFYWRGRERKERMWSRYRVIERNFHRRINFFVSRLWLLLSFMRKTNLDNLTTLTTIFVLWHVGL